MFWIFHIFTSVCFSFDIQACTAGHKVHEWESQPRLAQRGIFAGDFLLSAATLTSGNNFRKVQLLSNFAQVSHKPEPVLWRAATLRCTSHHPVLEYSAGFHPAWQGWTGACCGWWVVPVQGNLVKFAHDLYESIPVWKMWYSFQWGYALKQSWFGWNNFFSIGIFIKAWNLR